MKTCQIFKNRDSLPNNQNNHNEKIIFFVDDLYTEPSIEQVRKLTDDIYRSNNAFINFHQYKGYKISWLWFDEIYQLSKNFLRIKPILELIEKNNIERIILEDIDPKHVKIFKLYFFRKNILSKGTFSLRLYLNQFIVNILGIFFTFIYLIASKFNKNKKVAVFSNDYVFENFDSDVRLINLYQSLRKDNRQIFEFIRVISFKNLIKNIIKRRRLACYFSSFHFIFLTFQRKNRSKFIPQNYKESILFSLNESNIALKRNIHFIRKILKFSRINNFIPIEVSSRNAAINIAAKVEKIKTIGIMHGLVSKEDMPQDFMEAYNLENYFGFDKFGVWSRYYLDYYKKYSKVFNPNNLEVSGILRTPEFIENSPRVIAESSTKIKCLVISELHLPISQCLSFYQKLLECNYINLTIKVRPMIKDSFVDALIQNDKRFSRVKVENGRLEDIAKNYDVFIGTNSTAVLEASIYGKISVLLYTKMFLDYFEINSLFPEKKLLITEPENISKEILFRVKNEPKLNTIEKIKERYFGKLTDGSKWIVKNLC